MRRTSAWRALLVLAGLALAMGLLAACGDDDEDAGGAGTEGGAAEISLRLGYVTTPQHPYGLAIDEFVKRVGERSNGAIEIRTLPTYQGGDVPLLNDVRGGAVDMAGVSTAVFGTANVTSFDALQAPFLVTRYDLEQRILDGPIGQEMLQGVSAVGLQGLWIGEGGLRKPLGADKPLTSPVDFQGLKIRSVESPVLEAGLRALGADPTAIPIPDVYAALRDGTVDGMEANLGLIQTQKYYEVAKFVTVNVNLWPFPFAVVMNQAKWDSLSEEQQQVLQEVSQEMPEFSIGIFTQPSNITQTLCDEGLKFAVAGDADLAALTQRGEQVWEQLSENQQTGDFIQRIQAEKEGLGAPPAAPPLPEGCAVT